VRLAGDRGAVVGVAVELAVRDDSMARRFVFELLRERLRDAGHGVDGKSCLASATAPARERRMEVRRSIGGPLEWEAGAGRSEATGERGSSWSIVLGVWHKAIALRQQL